MKDSCCSGTGLFCCVTRLSLCRHKTVHTKAHGALSHLCIIRAAAWQARLPPCLSLNMSTKIRWISNYCRKMPSDGLVFQVHWAWELSCRVSFSRLTCNATRSQHMQVAIRFCTGHAYPASCQSTSLYSTSCHTRVSYRHCKARLSTPDLG